MIDLKLRFEQVLHAMFGRRTSRKAFQHQPRMQSVVQRVIRRITMGHLVRVCPGKRHAWFESSVGLVRKPYQEAAR